MIWDILRNHLADRYENETNKGLICKTMVFLHAISTLSNHCRDEVTILSLCKPQSAHRARILPTATLNLNNFLRKHKRL